MDYIVLQKSKKRSFLIWDIGYGAEHAKRLGEDGNEVYYYNEWLEPLPKFTRYSIGLGLNGVKKLPDLKNITDNFFNHIDDVDVIAFIFLGRGDLADWLRKKGYTVYGAGRGERLETDRIYAKEIQKKVGLPTQDYKVFNNVDDVLKYIKKSGGKKIIKINIFRGDLETLKAIDYDSTELVLTNFKTMLGPFSDSFQFVVEDMIEDVVVEAGFDLFFNGKNFLKPYLWGYLVGRYYVGRYVDILPKPLELIAERMVPVLQDLDYRGAISMEAIFDKKGTPYVLDWTCRMPYPLSYIYTNSIRNYSDVLYSCASGEDVVIDITGEYVGYLQLLTSPTSPIKSWIKVGFPKNIGKNIKLKQPSKVGGSFYTIPGEELEVATPVTVANSVKNVLSKLDDLSGKIQTVTIDSDEILGSKTRILEAIKSGNSVGLKF